MNKLYLRIINVITIIAVLLAYNSILEKRQLEEQLDSSILANNNLLATQSNMIRCLESNLETNLKDNEVETVSISAPSVPATASTSIIYKDGSYTGSATGFGGDISVAVSIANGRINSIDIQSAAGEDGAYLSIAKAIIPQIITENNPEVDTISGATFSSSGIKNAVIAALKDAE